MTAGTLIISSGQQKGTAFKLDKCPMSIGREAARDIQVIDAEVSRRHCVISRATDGAYSVKPAAETKNGVFVNGKQIDGAHVLADGDRILVGQTELTFLASGDPARVDAFRKFRELSPATRAETVKADLPGKNRPPA